jgi:YVTN family beta-propeller protein
MFTLAAADRSQAIEHCLHARDESMSSRRPHFSSTRGISALAIALLILAFAATDALAQTAYVTNLSADTVTPFDTETGLAGTAIPVGETPRAVAVTPDGAAAYVVNTESDDVTPIDTATGIAGTAIEVGESPIALAVAPGGQTVYVVNVGSDDVTPIDVSSGTTGPPIEVGDGPTGIAIAPDGSTAYVTDVLSDDVTPIDLATGTAGAPIDVGDGPNGIAIAPDGATAYVTNIGDDTVSPIDTATGLVSTPIEVGDGPQEIAITPNGNKAYVLDIIGNEVTPIDLSTEMALPNIVTGAGPFAVAVSPDGSTLYITNAESSTVTPVDTATDTVGQAIEISVAAGIALIPYQAPTAAFEAMPAAVGGEARFDASPSSELDGEGAKYSWDFGDGTGAVSTVSTVAHAYAAPGDYTVTLTVTNAGGCSTDFVFTGQTAACNGGPAARTQRTVPVAAAGSATSPPGPHCAAGALEVPDPPKLGPRPVPGVRATIDLGSYPSALVGVKLIYRHLGTTRRVDLGTFAVRGGSSRTLALPLPVKLRGSLTVGSRIRVALRVTERAACPPRRTTYSEARGRVIVLKRRAAA